MNTTAQGAVRVGLVGCGNVSRRYLENIADANSLVVTACADAIPTAARAVSDDFHIPAMSVHELLEHDEIDLVLNLTSPDVHAEVSTGAIRGGKHVYTEKPLATNLTDARALLALAQETGLRVGCAPDTFMGAGITACAALIAEGAIGTPVSANALMMNAGPEEFHPGPEFLYREGAGPLFDGGPYYVSVLMALLGSISRVGALATAGRDERTILVGDRAGTRFPVQTPTHVASVVQFAAGAVGTLVMSFDVAHTTTPRLEVHGTEGSIVAPPPNSWGGPVRIRRGGESEFTDVVVDDERAGFMGMGLVEMADALIEGRPHRATGSLGLHVLEVLVGIRRSASEGGRFCDIAPVENSVTDLRRRYA